MQAFPINPPLQHPVSPGGVPENQTNAYRPAALHPYSLPLLGKDLYKYRDTHVIDPGAPTSGDTGFPPSFHNLPPFVRPCPRFLYGPTNTWAGIGYFNIPS